MSRKFRISVSALILGNRVDKPAAICYKYNKECESDNSEKAEEATGYYN